MISFKEYLEKRHKRMQELKDGNISAEEISKLQEAARDNLHLDYGACGYNCYL